MRERYPRTKAVRELLTLLGEYSASDRIMFGQQNAGHIGISIENRDGTDSDCKRLTGHMPAVIGIDTLSLTGYEGTESQLVRTVKNLARGGSVITLSAHMPDFSLGGDGYYDYSATSVENDCGRRIMPGGDLNAKYLRFLDMKAHGNHRIYNRVVYGILAETKRRIQYGFTDEVLQSLRQQLIKAGATLA